MFIHNVFWLLVLVTELQETQHIQGLNMSSSCPPVPEGGRGDIEFHLSKPMKLTDGHCFLHISKDGGPDIITCLRKQHSKNVTCETKDDRFEWKGLVGDTFKLNIKNVTADLQGMYEMRGFLSGPGDVFSTCNFTLLRVRDATSGNRAENNLEKMLSILIPVCIFCPLCVAAIVILIRRKRKWTCNLPCQNVINNTQHSVVNEDQSHDGRAMEPLRNSTENATTLAREQPSMDSGFSSGVYSYTSENTSRQESSLQ